MQDLVDEGFERNQISLVANASAEEYSRYFDEEGRYRTDIEHEEHRGSHAGEGAGAGASVGAAVGGLGGLLMGLGLLAIPGVGPALAAGPIVSALVGAGVGAATGGVIGALVGAGVPEEEADYYAEGVRRGGSLVMLTVADERVSVVERIMNRHHPVDIEERVERWREEGFSSFDAEAEPYDAEQVASEREQYTIPVIEEEVAVGKREVERGGVRVRSYVREEPIDREVTLREERVNVERRPVDREVTDADKAFQEQSFEMTESEEEAVVDKRTRVKEEVVIGKDVREHTERVEGTVRRTEVEVEDIDTEATGGNYQANREVYRQHHGQTFAERGGYETYEPAYRYGSQLAHEGASRDRDWQALEPEARRRWEERNPGTWNDYREAVRYGYERERNRA